MPSTMVLNLENKRKKVEENEGVRYTSASFLENHTVIKFKECKGYGSRKCRSIRIPVTYLMKILTLQKDFHESKMRFVNFPLNRAEFIRRHIVFLDKGVYGK